MPCGDEAQDAALALGFVATTAVTAAVATPTVILGLGAWMSFGLSIAEFLRSSRKLVRCLEKAGKDAAARALDAENARVAEEEKNMESLLFLDD